MERLNKSMTHTSLYVVCNGKPTLQCANENCWGQTTVCTLNNKSKQIKGEK